MTDRLAYGVLSSWITPDTPTHAGGDPLPLYAGTSEHADTNRAGGSPPSPLPVGVRPTLLGASMPASVLW